MKILAQREESPLVSVRAVFHTGAAWDPAGTAGTASLAAAQMAGGGTRKREYAEILEALFPTAAHIDCGVDKEMTAFSFETHADNLETVYGIFREMLLEPGWREDDFERLRADAVNALTTELRGQNDEELGKEALCSLLHSGHAYSTPNIGLESSLQRIGLDGLKEFARRNFTSDRLTVAVAGGYPEGFARRLEEDLTGLPAVGDPAAEIGRPKEPARSSALLIEKPARSTAISFGYPIDVRRGDADFPALLLAVSCLGQHRMSSGRLFTSMRQVRGLNYGDYAYIEHFPGGMYTLEPEPNLGRRSQIFEIWIRPVEPAQAHFALRLAIHELEKLIETGLSDAEFERTRSFLMKYSRLLLGKKQAEIGYGIDSLYYGIPQYTEYLKRTLGELNVADVNSAIRRHLRTDRLAVAAVGQGMGEFAERLIDNAPSPISYASPKPESIVREDVAAAARRLELAADQVKVAPVEEIFA